MDPSMIVLGADQSGKLSVCRALAGLEPDDKTLFDPPGEKVTWKGSGSSFKLTSYGFDPNARDSEQVLDIMKEVKRDGEVKVILIVLTANQPRLDRSLWAMLKIFCETFGDGFLSNIVVQVTPDKGMTESEVSDLDKRIRENFQNELIPNTDDMLIVYIDGEHDKSDNDEADKFSSECEKLEKKLFGDDVTVFKFTDIKDIQKQLAQSQKGLQDIQDEIEQLKNGGKGEYSGGKGSGEGGDGEMSGNLVTRLLGTCVSVCCGALQACMRRRGATGTAGGAAGKEEPQPEPVPV